MPANKVPSGNSTITEALDELLDIIVGGTEKEEHLLKQISSKLNKSTLGKVINDSLSVQVELLSTAANMLTAIAGYLYGEKGLGLNTSAAQLLGKVKNNSPILGDKPMSTEAAEDSKKSKGNDFNMLLELKGITGQDLWALKETIDALKEILGSEELDDVDVIVDMADILQQLVDALGKIKFGKLNSKFVEKVLDVGAIVDELQVLNKKLVKGIPIFLLMEACKDTIAGFPKIIAELISGTNGKGGLVMVMNRINKAEENGLDPRILTDFFENVLSLMKVLTKVGLFAVIAGTFGKQVTKAMSLLKEIVEELSGLKIDAVIKSNKNVENAAKLIKAMREIFVGLALVGLLAIPAVVGLLIIFVASKLLFKVIQTVADGLKGIGKIDDITDNLKSIGIVVLTLGLLLVFAALTGGWVLEKAGNILGFAIVLSGFIMLLMLPFAIFSKTLEKTIESAQEMCLLIAVCALVMMLGAVFMLTGLWKESLQFGVVLAGFMMAVFLPFMIFGKIFKNAMKNAQEMALLIVACALTMMLGALFMKTGLWKESLLFAAVLTGFMLMVFLPFVLLSLFMKRAIKSAKSMIYLIITCALVLMLGALFMMSGLWKEALMFAGILALFIFLVVLPFGLFGKNLRKAMPSLLALTLLIIVSTIVLIIGANYVRDYGWEDALIFAGLLVGFVVVLGGASILLAQFKKELLIGLVAMAAIAGISLLFTVVLREIAEIMSFGDIGRMFVAVGIIASIVLAIAGMAVGLGFLATTFPMALWFWAGIAAVAVVAGVALTLSIAIKNIAMAAKMIAEATKEGFSTDKALAVVGGMVAIGAAVGAAGAALPITLIGITSRACTSMAIMISKIGNAVADISNLKVATGWDKDGNPTGYRQLSKEDFKAAAENTKEIITTLGKAIAELYTENPDLFKAPLIKEKTGFLGLKTSVKEGKTPFEMVTRSCSTLGTMITLIAQGVKDFADMKVATAWNADGNPNGYRSLKNSDFKSAAENIKLIVSVLGQAICDIYKSNKELFELPDIVEKGWFGRKKVRPNPGKTPFIKVTESCSTLGGMITDIANGVKDFASMQIATKWNSEGLPIEYRKLTDGEIKQAVANIRRTILTIFDAIMTVYRWDPGFFETKVEWKNGFITACNPVYRVISAGTLAGRMVSKMARAVGDFASMQIANKWDKEGNPIGYRPLSDGEIKQAISNIRRTVLTIFDALMTVYNWDPGFFETKIEWKGGFPVATTPVYRVIFASMLAGRAVSSLAQGVGDMAKLQVPTKWNNEGIAIKYRPLNETDFENYGINVHKIIFSTLFALKAAYDANPEAFNTTQGSNGWWSWPEASPVQKVIRGARGAGEVVAELAKGVQAVLDLNITDANGKKIPVNIEDFKIGGKLFTIVYAITTGLILALDYAYTGTPNGVTKHLEWFKNISNDTLLPIVESLAVMAEKILNGFSDKKIMAATGRITVFVILLTTSMNTINNLQKLDGVKEKLDNFVNDIIESLSNNAKLIKKHFNDKKVINYTYNLWAFSHNLTLSMNKLTGMKNVKNVKKNLILYVNPIIGLLCADAKLIVKYFNSKKTIFATIHLRIFTKGLVSSINELRKLNIISMMLINKSLKTQILPISINLTIIARILNDAFSEVNVNKVIYDYNKFIFGLFTPFKKIDKSDIKNFKSLFNKRTNKHVSALVKSINSLDNSKADKFIELSRELRDLSESVGDISALVDALNGRINETLVQLSESLDSASDTIKASDKIQDKRQKLIQKNTKELKAVLEKPMKLELSKAATSSSGSKGSSGGSKSSSSGGSSSGGGSSSAGGSIDTSTIETLLRSILNEIKK